VDDRSAEGAFGWVVRRLDAVDDGECPERGPDLEEVVREPAVPAGALALRAGVLEQLPEFRLDRGDVGLEPGAVVMLVLVGPPRVKHAAGELGAVFAEGLLLTKSVGVAAEVALQVRPTRLPLVSPP
jgi:hypothetical protein